MGRSGHFLSVAVIASLIASGCQMPMQPVPRGGAGPVTGSPARTGSCGTGSTILSGKIPNARSLGGIPLGPESSVACDALFRGPPLAGLTTEGCAAVAALGFETVIDLRTEGEQAAVPDDGCVTATRVSASLPIPYSVSPEAYLADFDTAPSIALVFHVLADASNYPLYFHCTYGRDRTGVVAAAVLLALGASRENVMREYQLSAATVGAYPTSLSAVLDEIDAEGGIDAALAARGVSAADLAALRAHAVTVP